MQPDAFTSDDRGTVRRTLEGYWAFFPNPLPRRLDLPQDTVKLLEEASGAVHRLGGVGRLLPNPHLLIGPHIRLEAVLSSRIEGTKTDVSQLLRFEAGQVPGGEDADDAQEVGNYVLAMEHGLRRAAEGFPVSVRLLREMHGLLLSGVRGQHRRPGDLRESPVWIGGSTLENAAFVPPPPEVMGEALADLERFLHETDMPLMVQLALAHYQFEAIHPFLDGNGRIGRLLIPVMLVLRGALTQPLLYLSAYFEQYRTQYYDPPHKGDDEQGNNYFTDEYVPPGEVGGDPSTQNRAHCNARPGYTSDHAIGNSSIRPLITPGDQCHQRRQDQRRADAFQDRPTEEKLPDLSGDGS